MIARRGIDQLDVDSHPAGYLLDASFEHVLDTQLPAILYADVAGYSRLTGEDEDGTHRRLRDYLDILSESIRSLNGTIIHYAGDAVLADFPTVTEVLTCAARIQQAIKAKNQDLPEGRKVRFRIGVNLGEVIVDRDEIYGDGVNVAARLESLAEPGGICISEAVRSAAGKASDLLVRCLEEEGLGNDPGTAFASGRHQRASSDKPG